MVGCSFLLGFAAAWPSFGLLLVGGMCNFVMCFAEACPALGWLLVGVMCNCVMRFAEARPALGCHFVGVFVVLLVFCQELVLFFSCSSGGSG